MGFTDLEDRGENYQKFHPAQGSAQNRTGVGNKFLKSSGDKVGEVIDLR